MVAARNARVLNERDDLPDCPDCLRLMVEALAKSAADPQNLALLPPEEAEKATKHLRELLNRPDDCLRVGEAPRKEGKSPRRDLTNSSFTPTGSVPEMHGHTLNILTNKARARSSESHVHAALHALDQLALDIEAGRRKRACKHCRSQYRQELQWTEDWWEKTDYAIKRRKPKASSHKIDSAIPGWWDFGASHASSASVLRGFS